MSANKTTAKTTQAATDVKSAEEIGEGNGRGGHPLTVSSAPKSKAVNSQWKPKKDEAAAEDREALADASGESVENLESIVLAQAATAAGERAADAVVGAAGASEGAADVAAGAGAGGAAAAETAVVASGFGPLMALPLLALGAGGGGGGGGGSSASTPPVSAPPVIPPVEPPPVEPPPVEPPPVEPPPVEPPPVEPPPVGASATVSLSATAAVVEGGTITYTASVGANPALSAVTVTLNNGQTITIAAGATSGAVTVAAPASDVYASTPGAQSAAIAGVTGDGGFSSLTFDPAAVSTTVSDVVDVTTVSLSAMAAVAEGETITYTASVGANPVLSDVTVTLDNGQTIAIAAGATSGTVTVATPAPDVYAGIAGEQVQVAAIAGVTGDGGFESLAFDPAAVSTTVSDVVNVTTVGLSATTVVAAGELITYTASVGANPALSGVTVELDNGQTISIAAGATSGTVTVVAPADDDVYAGTPGAQVAAIVSITGDGGFESLTFDPAAVSTTVSDVVDVTTVSLSATAAVAEGELITYTASVGANPALSEVTVTLDNGQTITIAAGATSGAVTVAAPADVFAGSPGVQLAAIASVTGTGGFESLTFDPAAVSTAVSEVTDITTVSLSTSDVTEDAASVTFTATLSAASQGETVVSTDQGVITIVDGASTGTLVIPNPQPSDVYVGASSVTATITEASGGNFESLVVDTASATAQITDSIDTTTVSLSASDVTEDDASVTFTATLSSASQGVTTVVTDLGDITIADGASTGTLVLANPQSSDVYVDASSLTATITGASGGNFESLVVGQASATAQIADTIDTTTVSLSATAAVAEGELITYTASVGVNPALSEVTVTLDNGQTITIAAGATSGAVTVAAPADVFAGSPGVQLAAIASVTGTGGFESLTFDPAAVSTAVSEVTDITTVSLSTSDVTEDAASVTFTATLSAASQGETVVTTDLGDITIADGASTGTLVIPNPQSSDVYVDASSLTATITAASGGNFESLVVGTASATANITDSIDTSTVSLSTSDVTEDDASVTFTATLSSASQGETVVTTDVGVITIADGASTGTLVIPTQSSDVYVDASSLTATITGASGGNFESLVVGTASATAQIADTIDTTTVSLSATAAVAEGELITYTASVGANPALSEVTVTLDNGQTIAIAAGATSGAVTVAALANLDTTPGVQSAAIAGVIGSGGFESLTFDVAVASTAVSYNLTDTAANLAAVSAAVGNGATNITATDPATVAEATIIEGFANVGTTTYHLSDTAAALSAAPAAVLSGAASITATDAVTVAQAEAMLALNPNAIYALADTAVNLAAASAEVGTSALLILATSAATVAEASAIVALPTSGTITYDVVDSAAAIAAANVAGVEIAALSGAVLVTANADATAAEADVIAAYTAAVAYSVTDTAAALAAATAGGLNEAVNLVASTPATAAEASVIDGATNSGTTGYSLVDTAANLLAVPATVNGATSVTVTDATISVADAAALLVLNPNTFYSLSDAAAALLADPAAVSGASAVEVVDAISVADADTLLALNPNTSYSLSDVSATLLAAAATVGGAIAVVVVDPVSVVDADALLALNANTSYSLSDVAAALLAAAATVSGATAVQVVDPVSVVDADAMLALNANTSYSLSDAAAALLAAPATVNGATSVAVTDPAISVADAAALLVLNPNTVYSLSDAAAALLADPATVSGALSVTVTGPAISVAEADALLLLNPQTTGYELIDTAANLLLADGQMVNGATSVTVSDAGISVADASALLVLNPNTFYNLFDTAAALLADAATVLGASTVTVSDVPILSAADADTLINVFNATMSYDLSDTAANLAAVPALLGTALSVEVVGPATLAEATAIHGAAPTAFFSITDESAVLASALSSASPDLATVQAASTIDVADPDFMLTVNADQFGNLLAGPVLLGFNDTIAIDGDALADLGVLQFFGGDPNLGMTLGGALDGSYIVDMGTSFVSTVTMEGFGSIHEITAAPGVLESFVMGTTSVGGSTINNLETGDQIDVDVEGLTQLTTQVATGADVDVDGEWAFEGSVLTWWDSTPGAVDVLTLQFAAGATDLLLAADNHRFEVI